MKRGTVNGETFWAIKRALRFGSPNFVAFRHRLSLKTILQVDGSKSFADYRRNSRAQHPPVKYSLRDQIMDVHAILYNWNDGSYVEPSSAWRAITEINKDLKQRREKGEL